MINFFVCAEPEPIIPTNTGKLYGAWKRHVTTLVELCMLSILL